MRVILGCTKDTSSEAMRYLLDFHKMPEQHKIAQVEAFLRVAEDEKHLLHDKVGTNKTRITAQERIRMDDRSHKDHRKFWDIH